MDVVRWLFTRSPDINYNVVTFIYAIMSVASAALFVAESHTDAVAGYWIVVRVPLPASAP